MSSEKKMIAFLQNYSDVIALQINSIQTQVDLSVEHIMRSIDLVSSSSGERKINAERRLENAYLQADQATLQIMDLAQKSTDRVLEVASRSESSDDRPPTADISDEARQMASQFVKRTESCATIDKSLHEILLKMAGCLSNADVMKQRLDHIRDMIIEMNQSVALMIENVDAKLNSDAVIQLKESLLDQTFRRYSIEEERSEFKRAFGPPPRVIKAYLKKADG